MNILTKLCIIVGFCTSAVAVSTAENAIGEKYTFCIIVGVAGLILMGLGVLFTDFDDIDRN